LPKFNEFEKNNAIGNTKIPTNLSNNCPWGLPEATARLGRSPFDSIDRSRIYQLLTESGEFGYEQKLSA
jgi:hypothetical protein